MKIGNMTCRPMATTDKIKYDLLLSLPGVTAISTQRGDNAIETDGYSGFNACDYTGDDVAHIESCRDELCDLMNIKRGALIMPRQTHSMNVAVIDKIPFDSARLYNIDALVTALPGVTLAINTADCVPIVLADTEAGIIGAVHSGWKGTVGRIVARAIDKMVSLGTDVSHIVAAMGPCICGNCFEVGDEVIEQFRAAGLASDRIILTREPRSHVDLPQACRATLLECGLRGDNIVMPKMCSRCNPERYFSARRMGINSGRTLSVIIRKSMKL